MKILRLSTLSLTLAIAVFSLGYVNPSFAGKKCNDDSSHPSCKDDDDSSPSENLSATFCLTIDESDDYILSDGNSPTTDSYEYCADKKEKVAVFTGSGDGFRWDTNMQNTNKTQQWRLRRLVHLSIDDDPPPNNVFEIDFRFNQRIGLDLGSLDAPDKGVCAGTCDGKVAASMRYYAGLDVLGYDFMNYGMLGFGALNAPCLNAADDAGMPTNAGMITVTRISGTQWTLESPQIGKACRFALDANGDRCTLTNSCDVDGQMPEMIDFEFLFIITQQD